MERLNLTPEIEHYEKKIYDLKQLIEISKGLNSTLNFDLLIESVLLTMMGQMHIYKAGIFLNNDIEDPNFYLNENHKGFDIRGPNPLFIDADSELIEYFYENNQCYSMSAIAGEPSFSKEKETLQKIGPELIIPLRAKGRIAGIIVLGEKLNGETYNEVEKDFLLTLASIAAIAVENARLYELATVDMMTRLRIHHYFQTRLKEELEKSRRTNNPLCLFITDIDHFKDFNDTYGHQTGDLVLKKVADIVAQSVRTNDVPARYGGEEFAIILPNTQMQEALEVAERVRYSVADHTLEHEGDTLRVTISVGVSIFDPQNDKTNNELIEKADKALYQSKKLGRNRVELFSPSEHKDNPTEIDDPSL